MAVVVVSLVIILATAVGTGAFFLVRKLDRDDILVVVGGVIPPQDFDFLYRAGVSGIYGPGTVIPVAAQRILEILNSCTVGGPS